MGEHVYEDAPLSTVLAALAALPGAEARLVDLAHKVKTSSGITGAYRAIGRLTMAGYAVLAEGSEHMGVPHMAARATIRLTVAGRYRLNILNGLMAVDEPVRTNHSGGFGVVHRRRWVPRPRQTPSGRI